MKFSLDIVIPTYNRPDLLARTLSSIQRAIKPADLLLKIIVVDNNSNSISQKLNYNLVKSVKDIESSYLIEMHQGRSWAINSGITHSNANYVAFIDDDEEIDINWIVVASKNITLNDFDYIVGACKPNWETPPPLWLPIHKGNYKGVLGWIEQSTNRKNFNEFDGTLVGGNSIVRRLILVSLNGYSTQLGRGKNNLMGGEDEELHRRLREAKATGIYDPDLVIFHLIPKKRMKKGYHLRWAYWSGCSNGSRINWEGAENVPQLFGLPRYRFRKALKGFFDFLIFYPIPLHRSTGFTGLMDFYYYLGMVYGKFLFKM